MPIEKMQSKIEPDELGGLRLHNKVEVGKLYIDIATRRIFV